MDEVRILATWLNGAAIDLDKQDELRKIVRQAGVHADEMYSGPDDKQSMETSDPLGVKAVIGKFAEALDDDARDREAGDS